MPNSARPVELFYSYSHKDRQLREKLNEHLGGLQRQGVIAAWHDGEITAGSEWSKEIDEHLDRAGIILLLVSSRFLASEYCNRIEVKRAMSRHKAGKARVIPVILSDCDWEPTLGNLLALPRDGRPISAWPSRDAALKDVAIGIRKAAEELRQSFGKDIYSESPSTESAAVFTESYRKYRNASHAFAAARKRIEEHFNERRLSRKDLTLDLKLLAIAMTQSWPFVSQDLPDILANHPKATIRIKILLSAPDFLDSLKLDTDYEHWGDRCRQNIEGLTDLNRRSLCSEGRLEIHLRTYKQIPHWHGLLLNRSHLYMGRAKWSFEPAGPKLTVGQNFYRGYGEDSERIALFEGWHKYYFDFYSQEVILPPAGSLRLVRRPSPPKQLPPKERSGSE